MKKLVSILLVVLTIVSLFTTISFSTSAATTGFDILSGSKYAKVYTLKNTGNTIPYTTNKLSKRGTVTYGASSTAYIANSTDELYLMDVGTTNGKNWAKVSYPIGSKRAVAYIALSAITTNNSSHAKKTSTGQFYCAPRITSSTSKSYYVAKGDVTYLIATDGNKYQILYPISGGLYRIGWCSKSDYNKYCGTPVTSVSLNKTSVTLTGKGMTTTLTATVKPTNATDKTITWKSSNTKVATVSSSGKVTTVGAGTATITATSSNGKTAKATVTVKSVSATKVKLSATSMTLTSTANYQTVKATLTPSNSTDKVTWSTSNKSVATVSNGKITAVANGTATITATTTGGKKATVKVTVKLSSTYSVKNNIVTVNGVQLYEYPIGSKYSSTRYANVNGKSVDMQGWECCGYARYVQTKLYGKHYFNSPSNFPNLSGSVNVKPSTTTQLQELITKAGVGAHIRTGANTSSGKHSMVIVGVTSSGFTIVDANSDWNNTVRLKTYTWNEYLNSNYGKSGFRYIEVYQK